VPPLSLNLNKAARRFGYGGDGKVTDAIRKNRWSMLSMLITVGDALVIFALVRYLYWRGLWPARPGIHDLLSVWGGLSVLLSLATAIVALVKDTSWVYGILALCLSLLSFLFYVQ
jgi:hypothetical protein